MSYSRDTSKVARTIGIRAGISTLQSKFSSTGGRLVGTIGAGLGRSATTTLAVTESFDGPSSLAGLETAPLVLEAGLLLTSLRGRVTRIFRPGPTAG